MVLVGAASLAISCGTADSHHDHHHGESLQLTAYSDSLELFVEMSPLVVNSESHILAHLTHLANFKPLSNADVDLLIVKDGKVVAKLHPSCHHEHGEVENHEHHDGDEHEHDHGEAHEHEHDHGDAHEHGETHEHAGIYEFEFTPAEAGIYTMRFDVEFNGLKQTVALENVQVYADEHEAEHAAAEAAVASSNGIAFTKEMSWNTDFATEQCRVAPFGKVIRAMAQVQPSQGDEKMIAAKTSGIVNFLQSDIVAGEAVNAGEALFGIESSQMADNNMGIRFREAQSDYERAKAEYERDQSLWADKLVTATELEQSKNEYEKASSIYQTLRRNFSGGNSTVTSPMAGYIKQIMITNGQYVEAGQPLAIVSQNRNLILKADLQVRHYPLLSNIVGANIHIPSTGETYTLDELNGSMISYGRSVDTSSPLIPVSFRVDNKLNLVPGSFVEMFIRTEGAKPVVTIPTSSLVEQMGSYFVFVQLTPEFFEKRQVTIGESDALTAEVLDGLKGDERIVTIGANTVKLSQSAGKLDPHAGHVH